MRPTLHSKVEEVVDTLDLNPVMRRRLLTGAGLASASLAATALLSACDSGNKAAGDVGDFPKTPRWRFVFVCHVTAHPFFTPTQYGISDACANCHRVYRDVSSAAMRCTPH